MSMRKTLQSAVAAAMLALAVGLAIPASAQQADIGVIYKRFSELYAAGNYAAALVEAQKYEAAVKTQFGANHTNYASALNNLAVVYYWQGKYAEAEGLHKRALAIREQALGANHSLVAATLDNLASVYQSQGKYAEAEGLHKRALAIREKALGANHSLVAATLSNLANVYKEQGRFGEAEGLYKRALAIREKALGANHPDVATTLNNLANVYQSQGKYGEAAGLHKRALAIREKALGANHPDVANTLNNLARLYQSQGKYAEEIAQWASQSSAAAAIQQMAARVGSGGGALAALVRESQDLSAAWRDRDKRLLDALSKQEGQRDQTAVEALRKQMTESESRIAAIGAGLEKQFPDYATLASPKPLKTEEVQKLLGADEAMVIFLAGDKESYVFAVTRDGFDWRTIPIGAKALSDKVAAFRRGLDVEELRKSAATGKPLLFDLALAHELYAALIGPAEALVKDKRHLLVVPTGALTSLPFHLLVTEKPSMPVPALKDIATYRDAAWLIKRQAVSVLPSVASLKALRTFARKEQAAKPMVGFGDPVFDPAERAAALAARSRSLKQAAAKSRAVAANLQFAIDKGRPTTTRAYSAIWQGAEADRAELAKALPSLLDTADELKAVAAKLGAPASDIHLANDASETTVKRAPLADYRVVYFATHGLVAGDVEGLGEPSLALTLPAKPTELDDGLLTASEVAQLKLNADWVVLSACNTAAGDKPGAEALSGLARAFFYAGARALLVSHWSVASDAAARLTTSTFDIMKTDPKAGRAEALRRAMLAYMNDKASPLNAYPAF
jgi:CHAT domain-containing protein